MTRIRDDRAHRIARVDAVLAAQCNSLNEQWCRGTMQWLLDELRKADSEVERLREQAVRLRDLLRAVTIDEMGGVPDLAWPRGDEFRDGDSDPWDLWDAAAKEALADD